jgi:hypothetical protein
MGMCSRRLRGEMREAVISRVSGIEAMLLM